MDLGPQTDVYPCPTCGVDAARAYVIAAVIAFYRPTFKCPRDGRTGTKVNDAAEHLMQHEPNLRAFARAWFSTHEPLYEIRRKDP